MVAILLSPFYIVLNYYIAKWLVKWMGSCFKYFNTKWSKVVVISIYAFFSFAILIGFLLPTGMIKQIFMAIGNYWLGVLVYVILVVVIADFIRIILYKCKRLPNDKHFLKRLFVINGTVCIIIIAVVSIMGVIKARVIRTTSYDVVVNKKVAKVDELRITLIADLHIGYNIGSLEIKKMVDKINKLDSDLVVMAGDIFDNSYEAIDNPKRIVNLFKNIKSKYGVYAVYGNHDIDEKTLVGFTFASRKKKKMSDIRMDKMLEDASINLLRDEGVLIDDMFYLYGRPDYKRLGRGIDKRKTPKEIVDEVDKSKPIIVVDHQPRELEELASSGVDLDLSGHTHDGQLFPGDLVVKLFYKNSYGYKKIGKMHSIVTSGVGVYGPNMRVGTNAEIVDIKVRFK